MNDKQYTQEMVKNLNKKLKNKQTALKFDNTPTEGSVNPVTSEGVKAYADASKGTTYKAGKNIEITKNNVINAKDTRLIAGKNITFSIPLSKDDPTLINSITAVSGSYNKDGWTTLTINEIPTNILQGCKIEGGFNNQWVDKTWTGFTSFYGNYIWTDGENVYYSSNTNQYVLDKATSTWSPKTWWGLSGFAGGFVWTDGENIYYSNGSRQYVLDKATSTWAQKTWTGLTRLYGNEVWTDGKNVYYSSGSTQYILNKATSTWSPKTWVGLTNFSRADVWTDGENVYYSSNTNQYVLDKATSTWSPKTWTGLTSFGGYYIWTDGENIYYSYDSKQYVLDKSTSTWSPKTWTGLTKFSGEYVWVDGENIYYSLNASEYILDKSTSTWSPKTWTGLTWLLGGYVWTDGDNIYYSQSTTQYVLDKSTSTWSPKTWTGLTTFWGNDIWTDGENIYCSVGTQYQLEPKIATVLAKVAETGSYNDLKNKPAIPNEEHLYIYSVEVDNGTDTITLINIQTSELLQSTLIFDDLIDLIQIGSSGVGDSYTTLQGSLGFVSQKSDTQFTLLTEDGNSHGFASTDTLTITSHLEKTIF